MITDNEYRGRARSRRFRQAVAEILSAHGYDAEPVIMNRTKLSEDILIDDARTHLTGVDDFSIVTDSPRVRHTFSIRLEEAAAAARAEGREHAAVIQFRPDRPVSESYVLMSLRDFCALIEKGE